MLGSMSLATLPSRGDDYCTILWECFLRFKCIASHARLTVRGERTKAFSHQPNRFLTVINSRRSIGGKKEWKAPPATMACFECHNLQVWCDRKNVFAKSCTHTPVISTRSRKDTGRGLRPRFRFEFRQLTSRSNAVAHQIQVWTQSHRFYLRQPLEEFWRSFRSRPAALQYPWFTAINCLSQDFSC